MKFYFAPGTIAIATGMLREEAGVDYDPVRLDFATSDHPKLAEHFVMMSARPSAKAIRKYGLLR